MDVIYCNLWNWIVVDSSPACSSWSRTVARSFSSCHNNLQLSWFYSYVNALLPNFYPHKHSSVVIFVFLPLLYLAVRFENSQENCKRNAFCLWQIYRRKIWQLHFSTRRIMSASIRKWRSDESLTARGQSSTSHYKSRCEKFRTMILLSTQLYWTVKKSKPTTKFQCVLVCWSSSLPPAAVQKEDPTLCSNTGIFLKTSIISDTISKK